MSALATSVFVVACSTLIVQLVIAPTGASPRLAPVILSGAGLFVLAGAASAALVPWWLILGVSPFPYAVLLLLTRVVTIAELRAFVPARRSIARTTFAEVTL